jgi:hypothetical protein
VLLGNGDGSFRPRVDYRVGDNPVSVVVADFNGDGNLDLVTGAVILLGNGDGTFRAAQNHAGQYGPVAVGDFNGDGIPDLAIGEWPLKILLGNGDGTFQPSLTYAAGYNPSWVAVCDFNGDGFPDLAVANNLGKGMVTVLLNAADWGGGPAPVPVIPHDAFARAGALDAFPAAPLAAGPGGLAGQTALLVTLTLDAPEPEPRLPATAPGSEAAPQPQSLFTADLARDAFFEAWADPWTDGIVRELPPIAPRTAGSGSARTWFGSRY